MLAGGASQTAAGAIVVSAAIEVQRPGLKKGNIDSLYVRAARYDPLQAIVEEFDKRNFFYIALFWIDCRRPRTKR